MKRSELPSSQRPSPWSSPFRMAKFSSLAPDTAMVAPKVPNAMPRPTARMVSPLLSACVGDGIEQVRTTPTGCGVAGLLRRGRLRQLGLGCAWRARTDGLVRAAQDDIGVRRSSGDTPPTNWEPIDDCYALNLAGEVAWALHIHQASVVTRVEDTQVRLWPSQVQGAHRDRRGWRAGGPRRWIQGRAATDSWLGGWTSRSPKLGQDPPRDARRVTAPGPRQPPSDVPTSFTSSSAREWFSGEPRGHTSVERPPADRQAHADRGYLFH